MPIISNMARKPKSILFSDQIRRAIAECGLTRYRLAQLSGVEQAVLSRFVNGKSGLTTFNLDKLAVVLNLELVVHGPTELPQVKGK